MISLNIQEMKKALSNKWFLSALIIGCTLSVISATRNVIYDFQSTEIGIELIDSKWLDFSSNSCFKYWLVLDYIQPTTSLFFLLLPILATLPYAWSYIEEKETGYIGLMLTRTTRARFFLSKYLAVFLSGSLVVAIPIILNFLICACFLPMRIPDVFAVILFGIYDDSLWSQVFYTNPLLYVLLFIMLIFVFSGLWASFTLALSCLIRNRLVLIIAPYLVLVFIDFFTKTVLFNTIDFELTPFGFLRGPGAGSSPNGLAVALFLTCLLVFSVIGTFSINRKDNS